MSLVRYNGPAALAVQWEIVREAGGRNDAWWEAVREVLEQAPAHRAIQESRHAVTYRVCLSDGSGPRWAYLKVFRRGRKAVRRAARAVRAARELRAAGLAVPEVLLWGRARQSFGPFAAFLLVEAVPAPNLCELAERWRSEDGPRARAARRRVAEAVGRAVAALHELGWMHGDLLASNLLVEEAEPPRVWFIDHDRTRSLPRPLRDRAVRRNLVQLNRLPLAGVGPGLRLRAFRAYAGARGWSVDRARREGRRLMHYTQRRLARLRDLAAARIPEGGGTFRPVYRGSAWTPTHEPELRCLERVIERGVAVKRAARRSVVRTRLGGTDAFVKLYDEGGLLYRLERLTTGSAARRALRAWERLRARRFAVPPIIAVVEESGWRSRWRSALVTRAVPWPALDTTLSETEGGERVRLLEALGHWVRGLHRAGLYPQDLRAANLLVQRVGRGWSFVLVDFDRVRTYRRLNWRRRRKNLVQIYRSLPVGAEQGKGIFLGAYAGSAAHLAALAADVERAAGRKERAKERRR